MPGFNRTGPEGQGSRTGRSMGKCNPDNSKNNEEKFNDDFPRGMGRRFRNRGRGRGLGRGFGFGRGTGTGGR